MSLKELLDQVYPDRRDRYGYTVLSRSRAIRAIKKSDDEAVRRLIDSDVLDNLVAAQAILPLRVIRGRQEEYVFLVQKRIRPAIVPSEWSPTMFADAALLILRAEIALRPNAMTVDDPHPWNVLFDEGKPYIVDMGAFNVVGTRVHWSDKEDADIWPAGNVFNALFLNVVALTAAGESHYVRRTLTDWNPIPGSDTALLLLKSPATLFPFLAIRLQTVIFRSAWRISTPLASVPLRKKLKSAYLTLLFRYVERMRVSIIKKMASHDTVKNISAGAEDAIQSLIQQNPPRRLVVYGASRKAVNIIIQTAGSAKLLFVSPDDALIDRLYHSVPVCVTVAVMDMRSPTPGAGPGNRWISSAAERFKSEIGVFFFDLNELVIEKCMTVSELIQAARNMSEIRALIVFSKISRDKDISGRNYGQTSDKVLLACLEQNLATFRIIQNDSRELVVAWPQ